ncbi:MAG TPA: 2-dehydropantoate 2-reductase [Candidatus Elarobacter sp.]|jgi:2-dehydropantoate 2-reductase
MKIGIVGAGALGLTFAAALSRAHDVLVLTRSASLARTLGSDGLTLERNGAVERAPLAASSDPQSFADREAVIVAVKAQATASALAPLRGVLPPHALVTSIQNGLEFRETARAALPGARVAAGSTMQGAFRLGAAHVRVVNRGASVFERERSGTPATEELVAAFAEAGLEAVVTDEIESVLWRKLIVNAAVNPVCALAGRLNGAVAGDPDLQPVARALANEAAAVAAADGIPIGDPWPLVEAAATSSAANRNSMLQDLDAGRPTEIDAICGAIVRRAAPHRIAVPLTETMLRLVRARERA